MDGERSTRHSVINNLPGTQAFCPLVWRTDALDELAGSGLGRQAGEIVGRTHPDVVARAAAFMLLGDSRASFRIERERPTPQRAARWGQAIAEAGLRDLSTEELERLQRIVIGDSRFVKLGLRTEGGFVGMHDRHTGEPVPDHISARPEDLADLIEGLVAYSTRSLGGQLDPVVAAASAAFGFVFIHPFVDGNGRIHRWLIHHFLARAKFNPREMIFPVSAAILRNVADYREVLEAYSGPLLPLIDWRSTDKGNILVTNDTGRFYRYFDATKQAEFLYRCVKETVENDLPDEVRFLENYDAFNEGVQRIVDMPDRTVELLHQFLKQGNGRLSKRARDGEFAALGDDEVDKIQRIYGSRFP
jgi:hypothetical protein